MSNKHLTSKINYSPYIYENFSVISVDYVKRMLNENDLQKLTKFYSLMKKRELHISAELRKRTQQLLSCGWAIEGEGKEAEFIKTWAKKAKLNHLLRNMMSSVAYGFSVFDLVWNRDAGTFTPTPYFIPQKYFNADNNGLYVQLTNGQQLYITDEQKFLVHLHPNDTGDITDYARMKELVWLFTLKSFIMANYGKYTENLGVPPIIIQSDSDKLTELVDAALELRSAGVGAFPRESLITLLEGKGNPTLFMDFLKYADTLFSEAILGSTLTSQMNGSGSYAAAKTHETVRFEYMQADALLVEETVNDLFKTILDMNFANVREYPVFSFDVNEYRDEKTAAEVLTSLSNLGLEIPESHVRRFFRIPSPTKGEKVLKRQEGGGLGFNSRSSVILNPQGEESHKPLFSHSEAQPKNLQPEHNAALPADNLDKESDKLGTIPVENKMVAGLADILKKATTYEEAIHALEAAYPAFSLDELEQNLADYMANAEILGRAEVKREHKND